MTDQQISRILIANRGEIAVRIARTARAMGLATVAVFSDPDADAPHVAACDAAVRLPGQTSAETYLDADLILAAARRTGADAIHPGYGFLSENPSFARAVTEAGLTWIGPDPAQIEAMALKVEAKRIAAEAGVPLVPGAELPADADGEAIATAGTEVGFPLLVKASAGGGGKGMRLVESAEALVDSVAAAQREAASAFGDGTVFLERFLKRSRHVEVQVFGDRHGNTVHLFERECSIQRRHQKVVEEAPSPGATDATREAMFAAAISLAGGIGYVGAGTVEFLVAGEGAEQEFFFLEMNTRLQVEHPVTEETTGLDLVEWQIRVARGEPLPLKQDQIGRQGHAIEVRLYAEDPANGYLPNTGTLQLFHLATPRIRFDSGFAPGREVTSLYDPMLAKVIVHAADRRTAAAELAAALDRLEVLGVTTNRASLAAVLREEDFLAGATTTDYLDEHPAVLAPALGDGQRRRALLTAVLGVREQDRAMSGRPQSAAPGWRNVPAVAEFERVQLLWAGASEEELVIRWRRCDERLAVELVAGEPFTGEVIDTFAAAVRTSADGSGLRLEIDGVEESALILPGAGGSDRPRDPSREREVLALLAADSVTVPVRLLPRFPDSALAGGAAGPSTPVPGTVTLVNVSPGDTVSAGDTLVVLEAMKMEHSIVADADGVVAEVLVSPGQSVDAHQVVVVLADDSEGGSDD